MAIATRSLVTGGAGYFGHLLVQRLRLQGHTVRIFDLNDLDDRPEDVEFQRGDIRDPVAICKAAEGMDLIFHNVAQVPLAKDRHLFWSVNRDGTQNALEAGRRACIRKFIYTSSSAVFGAPKQNPVAEATIPEPMEDYGRAKLEGERLCSQFIQSFDVAIIRPRTILGHGRLGIFQILFEWIYQGINVPVLSGGKNIYQFVHAFDLADACILAGTRAGSGTYNCGTDRFGTMADLLGGLCLSAGTGSVVKSIPMWLAQAGMNISSAIGLSPLGPYHALMYGRSLYFDISKARQELGWSPVYSNDEMVLESYKWYCANRTRILQQGSAVSHHRSAVNQGILGLVRFLL
jgi:nucleoside-diphosphate-sugar epimerase